MALHALFAAFSSGLAHVLPLSLPLPPVLPPPRCVVFSACRLHLSDQRGSSSITSLRIAWELATSDFVRRRWLGNNDFLNKIAPFESLPLPAQVLTIAAFIETLSTDDMAQAIKAIDRRNKVAHEGLEPPQDTTELLAGLFKTITALLPEPRLRAVSPHPFNMMVSTPYSVYKC